MASTRHVGDRSGKGSLADLVHLGSSPPEKCPYLPGRRASLSYSYMIFRSLETFDELLARGYRRSGNMFYQPKCPAECRECVPIRVPVESFRPSRSQRRLLKKCEDTFDIRVHPPEFRREHLELFNRHAVHVSSGATELSEREYVEFLLESTVETLQFEYSMDGELVGVGFLDLGKASASSIYFCWEPEFRDYSPGTFSALRELRWCREHGYRHYYLGYWIQGCASMSYKDRFRPYELMNWRSGAWERSSE